MSTLPTYISALRDALLPLGGQERIVMDQRQGPSLGASLLTSGKSYEILSLGTTNWQACGFPAGSAPAVGSIFKAVASGSGTGIAVEIATVDAPAAALVGLVPEITQDEAEEGNGVGAGLWSPFVWRQAAGAWWNWLKHGEDPAAHPQYQKAQFEIHEVQYTGSFVVDFLAHGGKLIKVDQLSGGFSFSCVNMQAGRRTCIELVCDATPRQIAYPSEAVVLGPRVSTVQANRVLRIGMDCVSSFQNGIRISFASESALP